MPSFDYLMSLESPPAVIAFAKDNLNCASRLDYIKRRTDKKVEVGMRKSDGTQFIGVGDSQKAAIANAVSLAFPEAQYPDPE